MHQRDAAAAMAGAADVDRIIIVDSVIPFAETKRLLLFYTLPAKGWYRKGVCLPWLAEGRGESCHPKEAIHLCPCSRAFMSYLYVRT